jgi:enolase
MQTNASTKYNRLLTIEHELGDAARDSGALLKGDKQ